MSGLRASLGLAGRVAAVAAMVLAAARPAAPVAAVAPGSSAPLPPAAAEVGKLADFIALDRNLFKIPPQQIAAVKVLLTVVGGRVVYQGPANAGEI